MSDWKHSKTRSELEYQLKHGHMNSTEAVEIVQKLQKKRIEHMKKLKKEMKKLEKIDSMIVGAAVGKKVSDLSIASSVTSVHSEAVSVSLDSGAQSQSSSRLITRTVTNTNIVQGSERTSNIISTERMRSNTDQSEEKENNPHQIVLEHISPIITRSPKRGNKSPVKNQVIISDWLTKTMLISD